MDRQGRSKAVSLCVDLDRNMETAPSLPSPAPEESPVTCDVATVAARQRSFEFFESLDPGRASRWADYAFFQ
jgi:hypothetical protein